MPRIRAVLFDYGHTLVDFHRAEAALAGAYREIRTRVVESVQAEVPEAEDLARQVTGAIEAIVARSYEEERLQELDIVDLLVDAFAGIGIPIDPALARELAVIDHRALSESITVPGETSAVLEELSQRYALGLVSNVTLLPDLMKADLEALGLAGHFGAVAFSSDLGFRKPDPRIFGWVLERLGAGPDEAVFVGDRLRDDMAGARAVGMTTVLTRQFRDELAGPEREEALRLGGGAVANLRPDHAITRLAELPTLLAGLLAGLPADEGTRRAT